MNIRKGGVYRITATEPSDEVKGFFVGDCVINITPPKYGRIGGVKQQVEILAGVYRSNKGDIALGTWQLEESE